MYINSILKEALNSLISCSQAIFLKDRQIFDNMMLILEKVRGYNRDGDIPRSILKIDIVKAYNTVN